MADRTIAQRELRNNVAAVLRAAEAGETFTVTVRGRPVARVVPASGPTERRVDVSREALEWAIAAPVDDRLADDLAAAEPDLDLDLDPWRPRR